MGIRYFDVALLVTSSRFTEAELMLAKELRRFDVPFFMATWHLFQAGSSLTSP